MPPPSITVTRREWYLKCYTLTLTGLPDQSVSYVNISLLLPQVYVLEIDFDFSGDPLGGQISDCKYYLLH